METPTDTRQVNEKEPRKLWVGYIIYGLLLACILLYYKFPSAVFGDYLQNRINRNYPYFSVSIDRASPSMPPGIKLQETELSKIEKPDDIIFEAEQILIKPKILSLLKEASESRFKCRTSGGEIAGTIKLIDKTFNGQLQTEFTLKDIKLDEESIYSNSFGRKIVGTINGSGTFNGKSASLIAGSGDINLLLSNISFNLLKPILNIEFVEFKDITLNASLKNKKLTFPSIELRGEMANGTVSGTLFLQKNLSLSRLDLKGTLEPDADFVREITAESNMAAIIDKMLKEGMLSFRINGTLNSPKFRFQ